VTTVSKCALSHAWMDELLSESKSDTGLKAAAVRVDKCSVILAAVLQWPRHMPASAEQ
jgi:hypothetical protein